MGRKHTYYDEQFSRQDYDSTDAGDFERGLIFVAMPFDDEMKEVYLAIKDVCSKLGFKVKRVDEGIGSGIIAREITDLIERAEFIIFDLTYERPNVYYELGYAHGVGNEPMDILLVAKEGAKIHFDINSQRIQFYKSIEHLRSLVALSLEKMRQY